MKLNKINFILASFFACWLIFAVSYSAEAATYSWYFSQDGCDEYATGCGESGDGTEGNPWQTLTKVQEQENTLSSSDTATFYFKRGDTWTFEHDGSPDNFLNFDTCIVHITAYGTGADPIFSGSVSSWATDPLDDILYPYRQQYDSFIALGYSVPSGTTTPGSTVSNIEIKNHHGSGIVITNNAANCTISNVLVHNVGGAGITTSTEYENYGNLIESCTVHEAYNNQLYFWTGSFAGGINMTGLGHASRIPHDNTVRYCNVYNVYGEGIWNPNGVSEYNVVGTTYATGIHVPSAVWGTTRSIVRHNIIYNIADTSSPYYDSVTEPKDFSGGVRYQDEAVGGDDTNGEVWIYGNIIINRGIGVKLVGNTDATYPLGKMRIFNNTFVDCYLSSIFVNHPAEFTDVKIYNNSSIFYSSTIGEHVNDNSISIPGAWAISNNHFWSVSARTVDTDWDTNYKTGNPELPKTADWRDLDNDKDTIDFLTMLYPAAGSALIGNGMTLDDVEFNEKTNLLTQGTSFVGDLNSSSFVLQNQTSPFDLGAVLRIDDDNTPPFAPQGLSVE